MTPTITVNRRPLKTRLKAQWRLYVLLAPAIILTLVFSYAPLAGWYMAFTDYKLGGSMFAGKWTGLKQFANFFSGSMDAMYTVRNTLAINLMNLFISLGVAMVFTLLMNEVRSRRTKKLVQTASFFPYFVSWVITYMIFSAFLASKTGIVNRMIVSLGMRKKGINFLGDPDYSWGLILFVNIWKNLGYDSVIFLAALAGIPTEQYEAADIDGATRLQKIWYITLPGLMTTLVMLLIMNSGWIFSSNFEQFYLFTNSTNWETMEVLDVYIYNYGLKKLNFSYATAVGIIKTFASIVMFSIVNFTAKRLNGRSLL